MPNYFGTVDRFGSSSSSLFRGTPSHLPHPAGEGLTSKVEMEICGFQCHTVFWAAGQRDTHS
eukprot:6292290-Prorocentrum_lima.AAC.1